MNHIARYEGSPDPDCYPEPFEVSGESVEEVASQLPTDYDGPALEVRDDLGSLRGWVRRRNDWRCA